MATENHELRIDEIKTRIKKYIEDKASLEVITARGQIDFEFKQMKKDQDMLTFLKNNQKIQVLARTRIELDGDIISIIPDKDPGPGFELDEKVLKIHHDTVRAGIERWDNYINSILNILNLVKDARILDLFKTEPKEPKPK